jgi:uncharacterized protein (TIGR02996 family)
MNQAHVPAGDDDEGFVRAIEAAPDDLAPRLVYADWLDERHDPRAELIRLEHTLDQLPTLADRYWELKPRRQDLRAACDPTWLRRVGYGADYRPTFADVPERWKDRWRLLREFVERWHRVPMPDVGGRFDAVAGMERRLGRALAPALREWVAFAHDLMARGAFPQVLHGAYEGVARSDGQGVSLMSTPEGLFQWVTRDADAGRPDPPVYYLSGGVDDAPGPDAASTTTFAFQQICEELHGDGGGFHTRVTPTEPFLRALFAAFPVRSRFGDVRIFEAPNLIALVSQPSGREAGLRVAAWRPIPRESVPAVLWEYARSDVLADGIFRHTSTAVSLR